MRKPITAIQWERFLSRIHRTGPDECWEWTMGCCPYGYGRVNINKVVFLAHRLMFTVMHGMPYDIDSLVLHTCDNPPCCNPAHLMLGDHKENSRQMVERGRNKTLRGSDSPIAKLTEKQVAEILVDKRSSRNVGAEYGVSHTNILSIRRGIMWKHVHSFANYCE